METSMLGLLIIFYDMGRVICTLEQDRSISVNFVVETFMVQEYYITIKERCYTKDSGEEGGNLKNEGHLNDK